MASDLIAEFVGGNDKIVSTILSTDSQILLEFFTNDLSTLSDSCKGGFLLHAEQTRKPVNNIR